MVIVTLLEPPCGPCNLFNKRLILTGSEMTGEKFSCLFKHMSSSYAQLLQIK